MSVYVFFFSSRRRHTRFDCDWSSDVCSSDLRLTLETTPLALGNGPHVKRDARALAFDAGPGRRQQVELRGRRFQGGAPPFQLVVTKADPRALDLEAVVPHVRQARYADALLQVGQRAAGDDHDVEIRRAGRLI